MDRFVIEGGKPLARRSRGAARQERPPPVHGRVPPDRGARLLRGHGQAHGHRLHARAPQAPRRRSSREARRAHLAEGRRGPQSPRRPTTSCARCARASWSSARSWRASAGPGSPCPAVAPSGPGPWTSTSRPWRPWGPRSTWSTATWRPAPSASQGADVVFDTVTVGGTENALMAAVLAKGDDGAAQRGAGTRDRGPRGPPRRDGRAHRGRGHRHAPHPGRQGVWREPTHACIPDRIEAGTLLIAGCITGGDVTVAPAVPEHLDALLAKLRAMGAEVEVGGAGIGPHAPDGLTGAGHRDGALPGFPHGPPGPVHGAPHPGPRARAP